MDCCRAEATEAVFDRRVAERDLRRYRRRGPAKTTRFLIEALLAEDTAGRTLLDIGGGVGAISHALLRAGMARAESVELSRAYLEAAEAEADRQGHADRLRLHHGDFVALADAIPPADVVTLDRVICCYPDLPALVGQSAARARAIYGLVYPRDVWWVKLGVGMANRLCRLRRSRFRAFVHPTAAVDALVRGHGFASRLTRSTAIWQVVVYVRA
jgi:2-polyprenyl-3-methyl-5-hydroxy-6-metoxy-1,4-benzoquinol methylase